MVNIWIEYFNIVSKNLSASAFCLPGCVCLTTRHSTSTYLWIHNNAFQPKPDIFLSDPSQIIALSCQSLLESLTALCEPCSRFVKSYFLERCDQFRVVFGGFAFFIRWILLEVLDQQADGTRLVVGHFIGNAPLARLPEINFDQKYFPPFGCFLKEAIIRFTTRIDKILKAASVTFPNQGKVFYLSTHKLLVTKLSWVKGFLVTILSAKWIVQ